MLENVARMQEVSVEDRMRIRFYTRQFADALSPANFVLTNPEVLAATRDERGDSTCCAAFRQLLEDLQHGDGQLLISMTDKSAFEVGKNIATTEGSVVFENDMMQLIQYAPRTKTTYTRPLLIVPPWINKFLYSRTCSRRIRSPLGGRSAATRCSSFHWINPDEKLRYKRFEDYMHEGLLAPALDAIETGHRARREVKN